MKNNLLLIFVLGVFLFNLSSMSALEINNISSPTGIYDYNLVGGQLSLTYNVSSDTNKCWYNYNSTNTTVPCGSSNVIDNHNDDSINTNIWTVNGNLGTTEEAGGLYMRLAEVVTSRAGYIEMDYSISNFNQINISAYTAYDSSGGSGFNMSFNIGTTVLYLANPDRVANSGNGPYDNYSIRFDSATNNASIFKNGVVVGSKIVNPDDKLRYFMNTTTVTGGKTSYFYINNTHAYGNVFYGNTTFTITTQKNLTFYSNNSAGSLNSSFVRWDYKVFENGQDYSPTTSEGVTESFQINLTLNSSYRITTGYLNYDGADYSATISINGNSYLLRSLTIPDVVSATNKTFFWKINLDSGDQINTTQLNQTVNNLGIDDCSSYSNQLFNISMYDEDTQVLLNGSSQSTSIKLTFSLSTINNGLVLLNYSKYYNYTNPARLCLQNDLGLSQYRLDGIVEYSSLGRFQEYYHFQNYSLTNSTDNLQVKLYNLNSSRGQEFKITYKDGNFVPVAGAILNIQRKYIDEGVYKTTEIPKTGTEGYTIGHLVRNDVIYNIIVMKDGEVLATFNDIVADCQNPLLTSCQINLNELGASSLPTDFTNEDDISFTGPYYNESTRTVSTLFSIVSGVTSTVQLNVTLFDGLGNTSVCSDSLFSSGGQLSCIVPNNFGNATIVATLYKDGDFIGRAIIKIKQDPKDIYGGSIIFIAMVIFVVVAGVGASSDNPMFMGIVLVLGTIVLIAMNVIYSPSIIGVGATILWFILLIGLVLIKGANRQ